MTIFEYQAKITCLPCILRKNALFLSLLTVKLGKPKFMCVIVGFSEAIFKDEETGIYVVPITSLKP